MKTQKNNDKPTCGYEGKSIPRRRDKRSRDKYYDDEPKKKFKGKNNNDDEDEDWGDVN